MGRVYRVMLINPANNWAELRKSRLAVYLRGNRFAANVLKLGGGTAAGQIAVMLVTPILTRIYTPQDMGIFGLVLSFIGVAAIGAGLRYELAIVSADTEQEADVLLVISLFLSLFTGAISGLIMQILITHNVLSYGQLSGWNSIIVALLMVFTGVFTSLRYWYVRKSHYGDISRALVVQGLGRAVVPIVLAPLALGWLGLVMGEIAGRAMGMGRMFGGAFSSMAALVHPSCAELFSRVARKNWKYPAVVLPSSMIDSLGAMLPLPIIASIFSTTEAGHFQLVMRIVAIPTALIGAGVADVFHSSAADTNRQAPSDVRALVVRVTRKLALASLFIYLPVGLLSPFVFGKLFGEQWAKAGLLMTILAPYCWAALVVSPISRLFFVLNRSELKLVFDFARLIVPIGAVLLLHQKGYRFNVCMAGFSIASILTYFLYFCLLWVITGKAKCPSDKEISL